MQNDLAVDVSHDEVPVVLVVEALVVDLIAFESEGAGCRHCLEEQVEGVGGGGVVGQFDPNLLVDLPHHCLLLQRLLLSAAVHAAAFLPVELVHNWLQGLRSEDALYLFQQSPVLYEILGF